MEMSKEVGTKHRKLALSNFPMTDALTKNLAYMKVEVESGALSHINCKWERLV